MTKNIYYIVLILSLFSKCKHEKLVLPLCLNQNTELAIDTQAVIVLDSSIWVENKIFYPENNGYRFNYGVFNPNNNNLIAYIRNIRVYETNIPVEYPELWLYDFCTETSSLLYDKGAQFPHWNKFNSIIFTDKFGQIWKVGSDGSDLFRLTSIGQNLFGSWSPDGQRIVYRHTYGTESYTIIMNEYGVSLDTLKGLSRASNFSWSDDQRIHFTADSLNINDKSYSIWSYSLLDGFIEKFAYIADSKTDDNQIKKIKCFTNKEYVLAASKFGILKFQKGNSGTLIKQGYDNRWYQYLDISSDETTALIYRIERQKKGNWDANHYENLYLMDLMSGEEKQILISPN